MRTFKNQLIMRKNKIKVAAVEWGSYDLEGDLSEAIAKLQKIIDDRPDNFDFKIDIDTDSGYYGDCSTSIKIYSFRWETDEEYQSRLEADKNLKKIREIKLLEMQRRMKKESAPCTKT